MKKLIALFAVTTLASTSAIAGVALSGGASVTYDDNGSSASSTSYDADIAATGTAGGTTVSLGWDVDGGSTQGGGISQTACSIVTAVGPLTVTADCYNEDNSDPINDTAYTGMPNGDDDGGVIVDSTDDRSVTVSMDAPVGDATIGLDNSGNITVSGTFSGVTISHTVKAGADTTTGSAAIAGMDISVANDAGATTWSVGTTVAGTAVTLGSDKSLSAVMGLSGNEVTVTHVAERAAAAATANAGSGASTATINNTNATDQRNAYTTLSVSRDLTSGAALAATWNSLDDSLTLKASVAF